MPVSTTTTLNDITQSAVIADAFQSYAYDNVVLTPFLQEYDLHGKGSKAIDVPRLATNMGTVGDGGTGVDTEFDATEGTDLTTTTTQSTDKSTITSVEYAVYMTVTDNVQEDAVSYLADEIIDEILSNAARIIVTAFEDDALALLVALNGGTAVGTSGSDLTLANMSSAVIALRENGVHPPDGAVFILDLQQASDLEAAIIATGTSMAVWANAADRFLAVNRDGNNGITNGMLGSFRGYPIWATGLTDTANTAADVVGALFAHSTPGNKRWAVMGKTISRDLRIESGRDITLRGVEIVASARWGSGELLDKAGIPIVTDA